MAAEPISTTLPTRRGTLGDLVARLRHEDRGFGLIELLVAMSVLSIGIMATVAGFTSGALALQRANAIATASAVADTQMELYRGIRFEPVTGSTDYTTSINLDTTAVTNALNDPVYACDPAIRINPAQPCGAGNRKTQFTQSCPIAGNGTPYQCNPRRVSPGPDGRPYRVDTYIVHEAPTAPGDPVQARKVKIVTVVVRDAANPARTLFRGQSTFDKSTGE